MSKINDTPTLKEFRNQWNADVALEQINKFKKVLVNVPPGYGKTYSIKELIKEAITKGGFDLIQVYVPTHRVRKELRLKDLPSSQFKIAILKPRPQKKCGSLNEEWRRSERKGLGLWGKETICQRCKRINSCFWPKQYGEQLRGADIVIGAQSHLERDPIFIQRVNHWVGAKKCLTIFDEANFVMALQERSITRANIRMLTKVLPYLGPNSHRKHVDRINRVCKTLLRAKADSPLPDLPRIKDLPIKLVKEIMAEGIERFEDEFVNILYDLQYLTGSVKRSRYVLPSGKIRFTVRPKLSKHVIIFSATCDKELLENRLKTKFKSSFNRRYKNHHKTTIYNLANMIGCKKYFIKNMPQILDFYVGLIAKRIKQGKKIVLVSKKCFASTCAKEINERFNELGIGHLKAKVIYKKTKFPLKDNVLPIITYGIVGVNKFKKYDCIYCLNSYYASDKVLMKFIEEELPKIKRTKFIIVPDRSFSHNRQALPLYPSESNKKLSRFAQKILEELEIAVVFQALSRVRFHTKPREVIMFQCSSAPLMEITEEFKILEEARKHFGVEKRQQRKIHQRLRKIKLYRSQGLNQREVAKMLGCSLRTVQQYWNCR